MPIVLHLLLGLLLQVGTILGFAVLLINSQLSGTQMLFVILGGFLVFAAVRILFRRLVCARCKNCGGRAFCKGSRPSTSNAQIAGTLTRPGGMKAAEPINVRRKASRGYCLRPATVS